MGRNKKHAAAAPCPAASYDDFRVDTPTYVLSCLICGRRRLFVWLGDLESSFLADRLEAIKIAAPVFIAGLARSGSTILLEYLAAHEGAASHRYRDFPVLFTPFWWNRFLDSAPHRVGPAVERAHRDGIAVTAQSPEAMEEMVWMAFFAAAHDPSVSNVLGPSTVNAAFERFYRDHIRKMLMIRRGARYVCKNNNNICRLAYLHKLFPDCKIIMPVRGPAAHIASLKKQHRLFCDGERHHPRALEHLRRVGHYEFGLDRRPLNMGDTAAIARIRTLWDTGEEVQGWAHYWEHIHAHATADLESNPALRAAVMVVRFEDLCAQPAQVLRRISAHAGLDVSADTFERFSAAMRSPSYYQAGFSAHELACIRKITAPAAGRLGYA